MRKYDEYQKNLERLSDDAFKNHKVRNSQEGRWTLQRHNDEKGHWEGFYWTEIVIVADGILVHGDIDTCLFKYYRGNDPTNLGPVHWVARSGVDYLEEKCSIGMDDKAVCQTFDDGVAAWEIEGHIRDIIHDICEAAGYETPCVKVVNGELQCPINESLRAWEAEGDEDAELEEKIALDDSIFAWLRAHRRLGGDHWEFIRNDLYEDLVEAGDSDAGEIVYKVGVVPDARLFYARAACRKLIELLEEKDETAGNNPA